MLVPGSVNPLLLSGSAAATGYQISRSLRFNSVDSAYLSRTPASAGNRKTWTWAGWAKRSALSAGNLFACTSGSTDSTYLRLHFSGDKLYLGTYATNLRGTTAVYRDASAWYHIVLAVDTTQATGSNRFKIYVNGVQVTAFDIANDLTQNADLGVNQNTAHYIGSETTTTGFFNGYLADVHFIDGQALTPSSFGESDTNGIWQPKAYSGSYGTNGFHLDFADNSSNTATTLGKDTSGNGNNWTPNNLSVTTGAGNDSLVDVPTNGTQTDTGVGGEVRGNYCTLNPLNLKANGALANGNLDWSTSAAYGHAVGTVGVSTGKWYCEFTVSAIGTGIGVGVTSPQTSASFLEGDALGIGYYSSNGSVYYSGGNAAYGTTFTTGDVIGVALDLDNGKLFFAKNGTWQNSGSPTTGTNAAKTGLSGTYTFGVNVITGAGSGVFNFGQRPFAYTAPSGYKALCTQNLPTPTILNGATVMDAVLYTGTGASLTPTSSLGFSPDLVWIKCRSAAADHALYDTVRGVQLDIGSNLATAETTQSTGLTAFNSNGFTVGTLAKLNTSAATYAGWCWDAGNTTVTNTAGTITSQVRANASAGFSVATFTAANSAVYTVGHGLGVAPQFTIIKGRVSGGNWYVWHIGLGDNTTDYLSLNGTAAKVTQPSMWGTVGRNSTVCGLASQISTYNNDPTVMYNFAPVSGYSAFGSYTGNGSADGPFVYTNVLPRWVMIKRTDSTSNWTIIDTAREGYNVDNDPLYPNLSDAEGTADLADILSNGFKLRTTDASVNASAGTYIYACFGANPFAYSRSR